MSDKLEIVDDIDSLRTLTTSSTCTAPSIKAHEFDHSILIVRDGDKYSKAKYKNPIFGQTHVSRSLLCDILPLDLNKLKFDIPRGMNLTHCPASKLKGAYIKKPALISVISEEKLKQAETLLLQEASVCERLLKNPHPRIATYFGAIISPDNKLEGLAFKRYGANSDEREQMKGKPFDRERCVADIKAGITHLHKLGIVHNDINPYNILFDEDDRAVIIDYDSARPRGHKMGIKQGTWGWARENVAVAAVENDWYGLGQIREFLGV